MCLKRVFILRLRDMTSFFLDNMLIYLAGLCLGLIFFQDYYIGPPPKEVIQQCPGDMIQVCKLPLNDPLINIASLVPLSLGLCASMASLHTFGSLQEQVVYLRESKSGLSTLAYFLSKNIEHIPNIVIAPIVFLSIFFTLYSPRGSIYDYYYILLLMHFTAYGIGYFISIVTKHELSQIAGVVLILIFQLIAGAKPTLPQMKEMFFPMPYISYLSYIRYGQEALYLNEIIWYSQVYDINSGLKLFGYNLNDYLWCVLVVPVIGILFRIFAYFSLFTLHDDSYYCIFVNWLTDMVGHFRRMKRLMRWIKSGLNRLKQLLFNNNNSSLINYYNDEKMERSIKEEEEGKGLLLK
ncbi:hypothetical protein ABK040_006163 [Willaertia magna]